MMSLLRTARKLVLIVGGLFVVGAVSAQPRQTGTPKLEHSTIKSEDERHTIGCKLLPDTTKPFDRSKMNPSYTKVSKPDASVFEYGMTKSEWKENALVSTSPGHQNFAVKKGNTVYFDLTYANIDMDVNGYRLVEDFPNIRLVRDDTPETVKKYYSKYALKGGVSSHQFDQQVIKKLIVETAGRKLLEIDVQEIATQ